MKRPLDTSTHFFIFRLLFAACCLLSALAFSLDSVAAAIQQNAPTLQLGKVIEKTLAGGETHNYRVAAQAEELLRVVVEQRGIDIKLTVFAPDGQQLLEVDNPNGDQGPESASLVTSAAGDYRIEVKSEDKQAKAGRYEARLETLRAATETDRKRVAA